MKRTFKTIVSMMFVFMIVMLMALVASATPTAGDVNGDGKVNIRDAAALLLYIDQKPVELVNELSDTNGDGRIDISDVETILKHATNHSEIKLETGDNCEHKLKMKSAVPATCINAGSNEYWLCSKCSKLFKDGLGTILITERATIVPPMGHRFNYELTKETHSARCTRCDDSFGGNHVFASDSETCTQCPFFKEDKPDFAKGYITTETTYIETEYVIYQIEAGVYVVGDIAKITDDLCRAIEITAQLSYKNAAYNGKKILIHIKTPEYVDNEFYEVSYSDYAEQGPFTTDRGDQCMHKITLHHSSALFLGKDSSTIIHELSHVLRYCQTDYDYNTVLEEGFAEYTEVMTLKYLGENNPSLAQRFPDYNMKLGGLTVTNFNMTDHDLLYWFEYQDYRSNGSDNYPFGFRIMKYLDVFVGNYSAWIAQSPTNTGNPYFITPSEEIEIIERKFGTDFNERFYAWYDENSDKIRAEDFRGASYPYTEYILNYIEVDKVVIYPSYFKYGLYNMEFTNYSFNYDNLYIDIDESLKYLRDYIGDGTDGLKLVLSDSVCVHLFDENGYLIKETYDKEIELEGVSYAKLVGNGYLGALEIVGFYPETITKDTVIYSGTITEFTPMNVLLEGSSYYQLLFRDDVQVTLKAYDKCEMSFVSTDWQSSYQVLEPGTEVSLSGKRAFYIMLIDDEPAQVEIIVSPKK